MAIIDKIKTLTKQLLPTGRAFWIPVGGDFEKLLDGLHASEARAYADAVSILDSALPDNDNFSTSDASAWERRLGLITNPLVSLADRKLAIKRKMAHPGTIKARQNYRYLEGQLQAAGFDVYVYENRFPDGFGGYNTESPSVFSLEPDPSVAIQHGDVQHGDSQHGGTLGNMISNSIDQTIDDIFVVTNLRNTFFVGGPTPGSWADVDADRENEFRQLILKIKPVQTVGFLLIHYV